VGGPPQQVVTATFAATVKLYLTGSSGTTTTSSLWRAIHQAPLGRYRYLV